MSSWNICAQRHKCSWKFYVSRRLLGVMFMKQNASRCFHVVEWLLLLLPGSELWHEALFQQWLKMFRQHIFLWTENVFAVAPAPLRSINIFNENFPRTQGKLSCSMMTPVEVPVSFSKNLHVGCVVSVVETKYEGKHSPLNMYEF